MMQLRAPWAVTVLGLLLASGACGRSPTEPPTSMVGRFDAVWSTFDREYSYFAYKNINWDSLRSVYRPQAANASSQESLVAVLVAMLTPLKDLHVQITRPDGTKLLTYVPPDRTNWQRSVWDKTAAACGLRQLKPDLSYCTMRGVAYVTVGGWTSFRFTVADLDSLVNRFRDAPAMIIDVRMNGGGDDALSLAFAGRFASTAVSIGTVQFRNGPRHNDFGGETTRTISPRGSFQFSQPVIVLAGRGVYSSNESFVSAMRELPHVTIMGDTTGGATGNPATYSLGDGWRYSVSRWIERTADRRVIEWMGIPPDVYVPWDSAAAALGRDSVLEAALNRLSPP